MAMAILTVANYFIIGVSIKLLLAVCIKVRAGALGKSFLDYLQDLSLLVNNLYFKFDWMKCLPSSLAFCFDLSIYKSVAINSCLVFGI